MLHVAYLMPLLPLAGFVVLVFAGRRIGDPLAGWVATAAVAGSFVVACVTFAGLLQLPGDHRLYLDNYFTWFHVGGLTVPVGILVDPLSMTMCMFITGVSALIHLYSIGYMKGDPDYPKFFLYLNLFVFSMLVLVLANNLLLTFVGWEGVGVCSYWLVSFWFHRDSAASAGKKAFIYNRIGDAGFLLAIFLIFEKTGTLQYAGGPGGGIFGQLGHLGGGTATAVVLLLFLAATGKSAQIPLFNWLPDAMEGPTPVSALIHAATMVTAGVYLLCRMNHVLALTHAGTEVIAIVGGVTAFVAATIACAQQDIKKVLAFSTVSQIGYMILAVGVGGLRRRHLPDGGPRLLQGPSLPGRRLGHPRARRRAGPQAHGRPAPVHEVDHRHLHGGVAGHRRHPAPGRLLVEGRRAGQRLRALQAALGPGAAHRGPHGVLHDAPGGAGLRGRAPLGQDRPQRRTGPPHAARVALDHAAAPRRAGRPRVLRWAARPAVDPPRLLRRVVGAGLLRQSLQRPSGRRRASGPSP